MHIVLRIKIEIFLFFVAADEVIDNSTRQMNVSIVEFEHRLTQFKYGGMQNFCLVLCSQVSVYQCCDMEGIPAKSGMSQCVMYQTFSLDL